MAEIKIGDFSLLRTGEGRDFAQTRYRWRVKSISAAISYRGTHVKRAGAASGSRAFRTCSTSGVVQSLSLSLSLFLSSLFFFDPFESPRLGGKKQKKQSASSFRAGREFVHENWNRSGDDRKICILRVLSIGRKGEERKGELVYFLLVRRFDFGLIYEFFVKFLLYLGFRFDLFKENMR